MTDVIMIAFGAILGLAFNLAFFTLIVFAYVHAFAFLTRKLNLSVAEPAARAAAWSLIPLRRLKRRLVLKRA